MQAKIHPKYFVATVTCACGNTFETGSTKEKLEVEICSNCHPFYTGKQKLIDTAGIVDRFKARLDKKSVMQKASAERKAAKATKKAAAGTAEPTTVKDQLAEARRKRSKVATVASKKTTKKATSKTSTK